jgi:aspartyl/asparaginyl beta-hydroxylase (cupin superfamily)
MQQTESIRWYATKRKAMGLGRKVLDAFGRELAERSSLGDRPVYDVSTFPWIRQLESQWQAIRRELDEVLKERERVPNFQDISPDQAHLARGDQWKTYFFYAFGRRAEANCARCPITARLVESIPGMNLAFFSIMAPGTHVPPHRGLYKGVLRYHLGLKVPDPERCRIRLGDQVLHWREGQSLLFDDTYEHEVWNESNEDRVVLFVDVVRPLDPPWSWCNQFFLKLVSLSPLAQDGIRNFERWNERVASAPETKRETPALEEAPSAAGARRV